MRRYSMANLRQAVSRPLVTEGGESEQPKAAIESKAKNNDQEKLHQCRRTARGVVVVGSSLARSVGHAMSLHLWSGSERRLRVTPNRDFEPRAKQQANQGIRAKEHRPRASEERATVDQFGQLANGLGAGGEEMRTCGDWLTGAGSPAERPLKRILLIALLAESNSGTARAFTATTSDKIEARHIAQHSIRNFECRKARPSKYARDGCRWGTLVQGLAAVNQVDCLSLDPRGIWRRLFGL